jgi:hypothetical protein
VACECRINFRSRARFEINRFQTSWQLNEVCTCRKQLCRRFLTLLSIYTKLLIVQYLSGFIPISDNERPGSYHLSIGMTSKKREIYQMTGLNELICNLIGTKITRITNNHYRVCVACILIHQVFPPKILLCRYFIGNVI